MSDAFVAIPRSVGWCPRPLKAFLSANDSGVWGRDPAGGPDDTVVLRSTDVALDGSWRIVEPAIRSLSPTQRRASALLSGDLVVVKSSGSQAHLGKAALVTEEVQALRPSFSNFMQRLRPSPAAEPRYLWYLLNSRVGREQLVLLGTTSTGLQNLSGAILGSVICPGPPLKAQRAVADYLDAESARIDAIVERRERQRAYLRERFESLVWEAVTGSAVAADLRESGLEWAPRIPRHWGTPPVGAHFDVQLGKMLNPAAKSAGEPYVYLRNVNVQWDRIDLSDLEEMHFDAADRLRYALRDGDLLVCEGGEVGRAAIWHGEIADCYYQKALHRVRPYGADSTRFLMYALRAAAGRGVFENEGNTSTIVHLTAERLRAHRLPWPPVIEQREIVRSLDREKDSADAAVNALLDQVDLLRERRQALITAAVTGQLEIPGVAA